MHEYYGPRLNTASGSACTRPAQAIRTSAQRAIRAAIEETLAILSDPAAMREIEQGRRVTQPKFDTFPDAMTYIGRLSSHYNPLAPR